EVGDIGSFVVDVFDPVTVGLPRRGGPGPLLLTVALGPGRLGALPGRRPLAVLLRCPACRANGGFHLVDVDADAAGDESIVVAETALVADVGEHLGGGPDRGDPAFDGVQVESGDGGGDDEFEQGLAVVDEFAHGRI